MVRTLHASPSASDPTARLLLGSRLAFVVLAAAFAGMGVVGGDLPLTVQAAAYLGLMGTVSLLHGGFEHVANLRGRGDSLQARYVAAYVGLVTASLVVFLVAPVAGLVLSVGVTVLKGGCGGLAVLQRATGGDLAHLRQWRGRAVGALVRGGAVMVVPYVVYPGVFSAVAGGMVAFFDPAAAGRVAPAFTPQARGLVGGWYAGLVLAYLAHGYARTGGRAWLVEAAETGLLVAYFALVPPVLAVGVYFPCWYAARQVARTTATDGADPPLARVAARVVRGGVVPWVGALGVLAGLAVWLPGPTTATGWVALYSVFVAAIAVPHVLVGGWLDRTRGIWSV